MTLTHKECQNCDLTCLVVQPQNPELEATYCSDACRKASAVREVLDQKIRYRLRLYLYPMPSQISNYIYDVWAYNRDEASRQAIEALAVDFPNPPRQVVSVTVVKTLSGKALHPKTSKANK